MCLLYQKYYCLQWILSLSNHLLTNILFLLPNFYSEILVIVNINMSGFARVACTYA